MANKKSWIIFFVVLVVIVIGAVLVSQNQNAAVVAGENKTVTINGSTYQSVFLINNQVYFGKTSNETSQFITLRDIYYLQVNQAIQPKDAKAPATNPAINLVKLGGELHGPTDEMRINRDQVLLIEDLRADSNVVKAIENYKAEQAKAAVPAK